MILVRGNRIKEGDSRMIENTQKINDADSILTSIKKLIGIASAYTNFDVDIILDINSVFMDLNQLGVGPNDGFEIHDTQTKWVDFIESGVLLNAVKSYMYLKVKMLFDPPSSSVAVESINRLIDRFEWRINVAVESKSGGIKSK